MKMRILTLIAVLMGVMANSAYAQSPDTVLVVANFNNKQSIELADYYMAARNIPKQNLVALQWSASDNADNCSLSEFSSAIATPIFSKIRTLKCIDYIVICRNLPVRIRDNGNSVDSMLANRGGNYTRSTYFMRNEPFSSAKFNMYLVTRLDGWSWKDATALVDRSIAARPSGLFAFDLDPTKSGDFSLNAFNIQMRSGANGLQQSGYSVQVDATNAFVRPNSMLAGYMSWGSNDRGYVASIFNSLRFQPGAIAETAVSTSASNLRFPGGSQSQIALLIQNGVTGVKGYVTEPYITAAAYANLLMPRYTSGRNLAESFYAASPFIGWKDVVIGDPLCAPYRMTRTDQDRILIPIQ